MKRTVVGGVWSILLAFCSQCISEEQATTKRPLDVWTVSRTEYREAGKHARYYHHHSKYRLICVPGRTTLLRGEGIKLLVGVERVGSDGDALVNPFCDEMFPSNLRIAIFDEQNRFVAILPRDSTDKKASDETRYTLKLNEMRGRHVEVCTDGNDLELRPFAIALQPGTYKFQLVACAKFFIGDVSSDSKSAERRELLTQLEVMRSDVATVSITEDERAKSSEAKYVNTERQLSAILELRKNVERPASTSEVPGDIYLTLTNLSKSASIGVIDPFFWRFCEDQPPVYWHLRKRGMGESDFLVRSHSGSRWPQLRSDFVVLPPQCVASCRVKLPVRPLGKGDFDLSVDVTGGLVTDSEKVDVLRNGDPRIGYAIGGAEWSALNGSSITQCHFSIE